MSILYGDLDYIKSKLDEKYKDKDDMLAIPFVWEKGDVREILESADHYEQTEFATMTIDEQDAVIYEATLSLCDDFDNPGFSSLSDVIVDVTRGMIHGFIESSKEELDDE